MRILRPFLPFLLLAGLCLPGPVLAQAPPATPPTQEQRAAEQQSAWQAAAEAATEGPAVIPLRDQAKLTLPRNMVFIPQAEATRLSRAMGNHPGPSMVGIVTTLSDADQWMVIVTWTPEGYVRDDEAKDLDPNDILQSLREGTEEGNKDRAARGFPELELLGWTQPPVYDAKSHQLTWSMGVKEKGEPASEAGVNFNTRALGRDGYLSLNLLTSQAALAQDRGVATTLLANLQYNEGKRYSDFNVSTDRVAEYGLAALIGVVAAKKLGLLAVVGVFLLKFAKVGLLALAGIGVAAKRLFRKKPTA